MNNEFVSQSELRKYCATTETDCATRIQKTRFLTVLLETKIALFFEHVFLLSGEAGKPGKNKPLPGPPGPKGDQGPQGAKGERGQGNGVNYVRWGRKSCPNGTQIVYQGKKNRWTTH